MKVCIACFLLITSLSPAADFHSAKEISDATEKLLGKDSTFASLGMGHYKGHYTMLAVRNSTGSAEVHEHDADYFFMEKGKATLITGGRIVSPKVQKPGEIRGASIEGGERRPLGIGDVVEIPAGQPHQLLVEKGSPVSYFVVKVEGQ